MELLGELGWGCTWPWQCCVATAAHSELIKLLETIERDEFVVAVLMEPLRKLLPETHTSPCSQPMETLLPGAQGDGRLPYCCCCDSLGNTSY